MLLRGVLIYLRSSLRYFRVSLKWVTQLSKTLISLCSRKFVCNFSGWAGMISIYIIRVDKKCDVFFQKQNGESNTDPAIILRRLHNLSARQARWLIPEKNKYQTRNFNFRFHFYVESFFCKSIPFENAGGRLEICQKIYTTKFLGGRILHTENA